MAATLPDSGSADQFDRPTHGSWARPLLIGAAATLAVLLTIDPGRGGPGVTPDEYYDSWAGKRLVQAWRSQGLAFFHRENRDANFGALTLHPPLGRWILGWVHAQFDPQPEEAAAVSLVAARFAPAVALGLLVTSVGWFTARHRGPSAGLAAATATALSPRLLGDAHFATLDTFTALFCWLAIVSVILARDAGGRWWQFALAGVVWGLACLTKLHGLLLIVPIGAWLLWLYLRRPWISLLPWLIAGLGTFFLGWPWLWAEPLARIKQFVGTATDRAPLHAFYWGQVWDDVAVPWHYPWVMLVVTLPLAYLLLGLCGLWRNRRLWRDPAWMLVLASMLFLLAIFSWPKTPVYDGTRLFLLVYPCWAVMVGDGLLWCRRLVPRRLAETPFVPLAAAALCLSPLGGIVHLHPCQVSYYSLAVGGLRGAERLGFEVTYWGDSIQGSLVRSVIEKAPRQNVLYAPNLSPYQVLSAGVTLNDLAAAEVNLVGWDPAEPRRAASCQWALVYHRRADLASFQFVLDKGEVEAEVARDGVWLARLYRLPMTAAALYDHSSSSDQRAAPRTGPSPPMAMRTPPGGAPRAPNYVDPRVPPPRYAQPASGSPRLTQPPPNVAAPRQIYGQPARQSPSAVRQPPNESPPQFRARQRSAPTAPPSNAPRRY